MTYPNILAMGYLNATGQLTPEWRMKFENAINAGFQRVLTFETPGGGFDWYGRPPAKTILTAYGMLMLHDMNEVYPIDRRIIDRARQVLLSRQGSDGSWSLDAPMNTWHQLQSNLPLTAYVAWCLLETGYRGSKADRAVRYVEQNWPSAKDPYVLALAANALVQADSSEAPRALARLESMATRRGGQASWDTSLQGLACSRGRTADIEATAMAALALARGRRPALLDEALTYLVRSKGPHGGWYTTQSTILALKALTEGGKRPKIDAPIAVALRVNGTPVEKAFEPITGATAETMQQAAISALLRPGENVIELESASEVPLTYQIASRHFLPWDRVPPAEAPPVEIETKYDKTRMSLKDELRCDVSVKFRGPPSFMLIVDLGIPAGFVPASDDFEALVENGTIEKFTTTGRQVTLYFGRVNPGQEFRFGYRLRPRFALRTTPPPSRAYEYYSPDSSGFSSSVPLEVVE